MDLLQNYWGRLGAALVAVILLAVFCTGPSKQARFAEKADEFCKGLDSKLLYLNESKRLVLCE